jgi:N-acetylglutamate synthase-like GNAT family acetyltransferase
MSPPNLRIRRATTDDVQELKALWDSRQLPAGDLEKRLTEFQLVETSDGQFLGAIGIQIVRQHARLHSEAYTDFDIADPARQLFWERILMIAANHGVFRLWTQHDSPAWIFRGFQPATADTLARLPEEWKGLEGQWFTSRLKDEEALATLEKELATFRESGKEDTAQMLSQAHTLRTIIIVIFFAIGILGLCIAGFLLLRYLSASPMR